MGLGGNARRQRHLDGTQDRLLIVMKNQGKDLDHLAVAPGTPGQQRLQAPEGLRHLGKGSSVA